MGPTFVETLKVERFHGVGPATAAKMNRLGIFTALDLRAHDRVFLQQHFGKAGPYYYSICRGIDDRPVRADRVRKSVGAETTFSRDLTSLDDMTAELEPLVDKVWRYCDGAGARGRTVTLKVKYADFQVITRSRSVGVFVPDRAELAMIAADLLTSLVPLTKGVRLLGVSVSSLSSEEANDDPQMALAL